MKNVFDMISKRWPSSDKQSSSTDFKCNGTPQKNVKNNKLKMRIDVFKQENFCLHSKYFSQLAIEQNISRCVS